MIISELAFTKPATMQGGGMAVTKEQFVNLKKGDVLVGTDGRRYRVLANRRNEEARLACRVPGDLEIVLETEGVELFSVGWDDSTDEVRGGDWGSLYCASASEATLEISTPHDNKLPVPS